MTRIALIFLRRGDGRWFIHQRRADKATYPGLFGIGAGGRIEPGERPEDGAARELLEETGLAAPLSRVGSFDFEDGPVRHEVFVFTAEADAPLGNHEAEWQGVAWASPEHIDALAASGQLCPDTALAWRMTQPRTGYLRLWACEDGTGWLKIEADGQTLRTTIWRRGALRADRCETTWHPRRPGLEGSTIASERLDRLVVELGDVGLGPTYQLYVAVENSDPSRYGGRRWRPALPGDSIDDVRMLPETGASFYEAVLGPYDDHVEDINASLDWADPLSMWCPSSATAIPAPARRE